MNKPELIGWTITTNENGVEMATLPAEHVRQAVAYIEVLEAKVKEISSRQDVSVSLPTDTEILSRAMTKCSHMREIGTINGARDSNTAFDNYVAGAKWMRESVGNDR